MNANEILLLKWGLTETANGPVVVSARSAVAIPEFQRANGREEFPVDFEHSTVGAEPDEEPRKVFGYARCHVVIPQAQSLPGSLAPGLYMTLTRITDDGREYSQHYADLSPALILDPATNEVLGVDSVAVTRTGAVPGLHLPAITFSVHPIRRFSSQPTKPTMPANSTDPAPAANPALPATALTALRKLLGLPETADEAATLDALNQAAAAMDAPAAVMPCSAPNVAGASSSQAPADTLARVAKLEADILRMSAILALPQTPRETPGASVTAAANTAEADAARAKRERAVAFVKLHGISFADALKLA